QVVAGVEAEAVERVRSEAARGRLFETEQIAQRVRVLRVRQAHDARARARARLAHRAARPRLTLGALRRQRWRIGSARRRWSYRPAFVHLQRPRALVFERAWPASNGGEQAKRRDGAD